MTNEENIKRLKEILQHVTEARDLAQAAHELGEFHLTPVFHKLTDCAQAVTARLYQLDSFTQEDEARKKQAVLFAEEKKRKEAAEKAAAEKAAADVKTVAEAEGQRIERERVMRVGTPKERLNIRTIEELKLIAAGMSLKGLAVDATKEQYVAAILRAEKADGGQVEP